MKTYAEAVREHLSPQQCREALKQYHDNMKYTLEETDPILALGPDQELFPMLQILGSADLSIEDREALLCLAGAIALYLQNRDKGFRLTLQLLLNEISILAVQDNRKFSEDLAEIVSNLHTYFRYFA